jgi:predicted adenine nucleotide alpha hydrolase (AANH) superfamily ATPase
VVERLAASYDVTLFFYNPNIDDEAEYRRRLEAQKQFVERFNASRKFLDTARVRLVVGPYEPQQFLCEVAGHEEDPEAGARCAICFRMRLFKTAEYAVLHGFSLFTTTLSVSPHKDAQLLAKIGTEAAFAYGISYLPEDFKKQNGFGRSAELARAYELYRQNYCGCTFSKR